MFIVSRRCKDDGSAQTCRHVWITTETMSYQNPYANADINLYHKKSPKPAPNPYPDSCPNLFSSYLHPCANAHLQNPNPIHIQIPISIPTQPYRNLYANPDPNPNAQPWRKRYTKLFRDPSPNPCPHNYRNSSSNDPPTYAIPVQSPIEMHVEILIRVYTV